MSCYGGLDWGVAAHAVCLVDERGKVLARIDVGHDAAGLDAMFARLRRITPVAELPDGPIIMSFPRAGRIRAAQILSELGDVRQRFLTEDQLAAEAGVASVTHASAKSRSVVCRWACKKNLRAAITCFADNSRHACAWVADIYQRAKQRGRRHPHATRILARAWVRVLWRAWQNQTTYDPATHREAANFAA